MRISDWSSDVCSSDLLRQTFRPGDAARDRAAEREYDPAFDLLTDQIGVDDPPAIDRAEDPVDIDALILVDRDFGKHRHHRACRLVDGAALRHLARKRRTIGRESCRDRVCQYV